MMMSEFGYRLAVSPVECIHLIAYHVLAGAPLRSKDEETLESVFYNQLYGYNTAGRDGRWISLPLKRKKKMGGGKRKKKPAAVIEAPKEEKEEAEEKMDQDGEEDEDVEMDEGQAKPWEVAKAKALAAALAEDDDPDDPEKVSTVRSWRGRPSWCGADLVLRRAIDGSDGAVQHDARGSA